MERHGEGKGEREGDRVRKRRRGRVTQVKGVGERESKIDVEMRRSDFNLKTEVAECSTYRAGKPWSDLSRLHRTGIELRYPRCPSRSCRNSPSVLLNASQDIFGGTL